jgi:hypothetical protein
MAVDQRAGALNVGTQLVERAEKIVSSGKHMLGNYALLRVIRLEKSNTAPIDAASITTPGPLSGTVELLSWLSCFPLLIPPLPLPFSTAK